MGIKKLDDNKYQIDYRDAERKRHRETIAGSKTFASQVLTKRKTEIAEGKFFPDKQKNKVMFRDIAEKYWKIHGSKTKGAEKSIYIFKQIIDLFGDKRVSDITVEDVQDFYNDILITSSSSTANRHYSVFRAIINKALKLRIYEGPNPCNGVVRQRENPPREEYLTLEQIGILIKAASPRIRPLLAFAIMTGMRRGEILNVNWQDIDFNADIIHIYKSKSGKGRKVPVLPELKEILLKIKSKSAGKVFQITVPTLRREFSKALRKAGIAGIRFHDLRHTFASHFMMNGGNISYLKDILGHSSTELTTRYAHLSPHILKQAINAVANIVPIDSVVLNGN